MPENYGEIPSKSFRQIPINLEFKTDIHILLDLHRLSYFMARENPL